MIGNGFIGVQVAQRIDVALGSVNGVPRNHRGGAVYRHLYDRIGELSFSRNGEGFFTPAALLPVSMGIRNTGRNSGDSNFILRAGFKIVQRDTETADSRMIGNGFIGVQVAQRIDVALGSVNGVPRNHRGGAVYRHLYDRVGNLSLSRNGEGFFAPAALFPVGMGIRNAGRNGANGNLILNAGFKAVQRDAETVDSRMIGNGFIGVQVAQRIDVALGSVNGVPRNHRGGAVYRHLYDRVGKLSGLFGRGRVMTHRAIPIEIKRVLFLLNVFVLAYEDFLTIRTASLIICDMVMIHSIARDRLIRVIQVNLLLVRMLAN